MKEYQRQKAIEEAKHHLKELEELKEKQTELEKYKENPVVIAYLKLLKDIALLEEKYKFGKKTEEEIIRKSFCNVCQQKKCSHPIWIYQASEYIKLYKSDKHIEDEYKRIEELFNDYVAKLSENYESDEPNFTFEFINNYYICLECGVSAVIFNWEEFEKKHFVLKNQNERINIEYYRNLYYQLLYTKTVKEAQKIVIEEFEKNKQSSKIKILKKEDNK